MEFTKTPFGNEVLKGEGFFISYRAHTGGSALFGSLIISLLGGDDSYLGEGPETALVFEGKYMILNGDFRKEYKGIIDQGLEACLTFFKGQESDHASPWTTP